MPFHIQLRGGVKRAWAFNVDEDQLRQDIVAPWLHGREFDLGDQRWKPAESDLRIISGPELPPPDLAFGQGWNAAERSGRDVTREFLTEATSAAPDTVKVVAETREIGEAAARALRAAGFVAIVIVEERGD
jgi:hypothetical protein